MSKGNLFNQISNFSANKSSSYIRTLPEYLNVRFPLSLTHTHARAKVKRVKSKEKYFKKSPIKFKLRHTASEFNGREKWEYVSGGRERERNFSI